MRPDWRPVLEGDVLFEEGVVKFWADAYGVSPPDLPDVGPDDHQAPLWTFERGPDENVVGSRFIAVKT